jgi:O-succinylbenzoic acid--CoA ligase
MSVSEARALPAMRREAHFGDRVVRCFVERPGGIDQMLRETVGCHGAREALVFEGESWSWSELALIVDRIATGLQADGIGRGDRVAMLIGNRPEFVFSFLAIQRLGAIAVPISIREQSPGIAYMLGQCGAVLLLHEDELADRLPPPDALPARVRYCSVDGDTWRQWQALRRESTLASAPSAGQATRDPLPATRDPLSAMREMLPGDPTSEEETAVILYTSGTTGRPKGAMLSHFNIVHSAMHYEHCMALTCEDRSVMAVPASHVTGLVAMIVAMLRVGGALVIARSFKARAFLELAAAQRITHTILVPAMYQLCLLEPDFATFDLGAWRIGAYGGAPMPRATIEALAERLPRLTLMNAYGATETTSPATIMPPGLQADHLASVGRPVPAADIRVMDDVGCEVPAGETGELWIGGPMVVRGYWDNPQATAASFTGGYWRSGDIGSIDADGFVQVFDRKKDMINRGGYKIYSVEVENVLAGCEGVLEAAVVGRPCPVLGERVHAVLAVTPQALAEPTACEERLRAWCAERLADYKVPETWVIQAEPLPRNANGKLMKRSLRPA